MNPLGSPTGKSASFRSFVRACEAVCGREVDVILTASPPRPWIYFCSSSCVSGRCPGGCPFGVRGCPWVSVGVRWVSVGCPLGVRGVSVGCPWVSVGCPSVDDWLMID